MALSEAIIATYITIHIARSPSSHSETIAISLQELQEETANPKGVAFRQRKHVPDIPRRPPRHAYPSAAVRANSSCSIRPSTNLDELTLASCARANVEGGES
jgi:hypothetical protein